MTALVVVLVLALAAGVLAVVELIRTRGVALLAWAVLAVALAVAWPHLTAL